MQGIAKCFIFLPVKLHQIVSTMVCKLLNLWYNKGTHDVFGAGKELFAYDQGRYF